MATIATLDRRKRSIRRLPPLFAFSAGGLDITGTPTTTATEGVAYSAFTPNATGGTAPYTFSFLGVWPTGLSINSSTGEVTGTPTESGTFTGLSVRVTDNVAATDDLATFAIAITPVMPTISASGAYSMNFDGEQPLFAKDENTSRDPASTVKLATAILFIRDTSNWAATKTIITADLTAGSGPTHLNGDVISNEDLLYDLLVASSNTAAACIGRTVGANLGGTADTAQFVSAMNDLCTEFNLTNTTFLTPHGVNAISSMSAKDMCLLLKAAMEEDALVETVIGTATRGLVITGGRSTTLNVSTSNLLLYDSSIGIGTVPIEPGIVGGKTGTTASNIANLVVCWEDPETGERIVSCIMASPTDTDRYIDMRITIDQIQRDWEWLTVTPTPKTADQHSYTNTEAKAVIRYWSTAPITAHKDAVDDFFTAIKADIGGAGSILARLDYLHVELAATVQQTHKSWVNPAFRDAILVGAPAFTAFACHAPNGTSDNKRFNWNPTLAGVQWAQNDACVFGRNQTNRAAAATKIMGFQSHVRINPFVSPTGMAIRVNTTTSGTISHGGTSNGFYLGNRTASNVILYRRNGVTVGTDTQASVAPSSNGFRLWTDATNFTDDKISIAGWGRALTTGQISALEAAESTLNTALLALA